MGTDGNERGREQERRNGGTDPTDLGEVTCEGGRGEGGSSHYCYMRCSESESRESAEARAEPRCESTRPE
eukprot:scaffold70485_cov32-Tisochrysis_lutea.AAC.4